MEYLENSANILVNEYQFKLLKDKENISTWIYFNPKTKRYKRDDKRSTYLRKVVTMLIKNEGLAFQGLNIPEKISEQQEKKVNYVSSMRKEIISNLEIHAPKLTEDDCQPQEGYLPCKNGIVNCKTGELMDYSKETPILDTIPCNYIPEINECPEEYYKMISEALHDENLSKKENELRVESFMDIRGATFTGDLALKFMIIMPGPTNTGKTVDQNQFKKMLGPYAGTMNSKSLTKRKNSNDELRADFISNRNCLNIFSSEGSEDTTIESSFIKEASGKDESSFRRPHGKDNIDFYFRGIIILITNYIPKLDKEDEALIKRIIIMDFKNSVPADQIDPDLPKKLLAKKDELFSYLCKRAMNFYKNDKRLNIHSSFVKSKEYFLLNQSNPVSKFIKEKVDFAEKLGISIIKRKVSAQWIYFKAFLPYLQQINFTRNVSFDKFAKDFSRILSSYPSIQKHRGGDCNYYTGIEIVGCPPDDTFPRRVFNEKSEKAAQTHLQEFLQNPYTKVSAIIAGSIGLAKIFKKIRKMIKKK